MKLAKKRYYFLGSRCALATILYLFVAACGSQPTSSAPDEQPSAAEGMHETPLLSTPEPSPTDRSVTRRELVDMGLDNTLTLIARDSSGDEIAQGSGFFISNGNVVTNAHVVAGAAWVEIIDLEGQQVATAPYALAVDIENDLAVLPTPHRERQGLKLSDDSIQIGDDVWAFGAPLGLDGTTSSGIVSAFREAEGMSLIQMTAPISPGSSGGPVLNDNGELVGVATLIMSGGQNLNFAVPVDDLKALRFTSDDRRSFPSSSAFEDELDEQFDELLSLLVEFTISPQISIGEEFRGVLDQNSPYLDGFPYSIYRFNGYEGQQLRIDVMSNQFDTVIELIRETEMFEDNEWYIWDDDGGDGTNSRIQTALPDTDTYYLLIHSYDDRVGEYTVSVRETASGQHGLTDGRWQFVSESVSDARFYVDTQTVRRTQGDIVLGQRLDISVNAWVLMELAQPSELQSGESYDSVMTLYQFDCSGRRETVKSMNFQFEGRLVAGEEIPRLSQSWKAITPGSVAEALLEYVCNQ